MVDIAEGREAKVPATIEDPAVLEEIAAVLHEMGFSAAGPSD